MSKKCTKIIPQIDTEVQKFISAKNLGFFSTVYIVAQILDKSKILSCNIYNHVQEITNYYIQIEAESILTVYRVSQILNLWRTLLRKLNTHVQEMHK